MKSKTFKLIIALILVFNFAIILYSDEVDIKTTEINILENGKLLTGSKGFNIITDNNIEIIGDEFSYNKVSLELSAKGNIEIIDQLNEIKINSEIIEYKKKEEKFLIKNKATINYKNSYIKAGLKPPKNAYELDLSSLNNFSEKKFFNWNRFIFKNKF